MIKNLAIVVNTNSSMKDMWKMFIGELEEFFPKQKVYFFSDVKSEYFFNYHTVIYDKKINFSEQYYSCLKRVKEDYIITLNEDYILYAFVKVHIIKNFLKILKENNKISFIRFHKGPNFTNKKFTKNLYYLDESKRHLYSQTATLWKRRVLLDLYKDAPKSHIGKNYGNNRVLCAEDEIDKICREKKIKGLSSFYDEKLLGHSNYDSYVFPYLQSVIIKGCWNFKEYQNELLLLFKKYKINKESRELFLNNYKDKTVSFLKKICLKNEY